MAQVEVSQRKGESSREESALPATAAAANDSCLKNGFSRFDKGPTFRAKIGTQGEEEISRKKEI